MEDRYSRNIPSLSEEEMNTLRRSHVLVAGCGGLGGYVIEQLARIGTGALTVADGDVFKDSNLNRQILCTAETIGENKAMAAVARVRSINPSIRVTPVCENLTKENAPAIMAGADIIIDALDSIEARFMLEDAAASAGLAIVHGAVNGWDLQAMLIAPGSGMLHRLYSDVPETSDKSVLSFTPAACASLQVSIAVSFLCGRETHSGDKLIIGSLADMRFETIHLT